MLILNYNITKCGALHMISFKTTIPTSNIGGIRIGGEFGENPTVLIGSMFYTGHRIVEKRSEGTFDRQRAEILIKNQEELSDQTGIPSMLDIVAVRPIEFEKYIDFISSVTDMPFAVDAWQDATKLEAARIIHEMGLQKQSIYNSLSPWSKDIEQEVEQLMNYDLENVILVAFNQEDSTIDGRLSILNNFLIPYAQKAGFSNFLVDTSVLNAPSTAISLLTGSKIRTQVGLPVGCGPSNGTDPKAWSLPKKQWGKFGFIGVDASIQGISALWNDYLLYGPIENAQWVFPAVALAETIKTTFRAEATNKLPESIDHPLNLLFSEFAVQLKKSYKS